MSRAVSTRVRVILLLLAVLFVGCAGAKPVPGVARSGNAQYAVNIERGQVERRKVERHIERRHVERRHVELRQHHARAIFLATRDDDQPRHVTSGNVALKAFDPPLSSDPTILIDLPAMLEAPACIVDARDCAIELPRD